MLAYFVIGVELAILYTVFWYVFLREPKPYRIKGNAWGAYHEPEPQSGLSAQLKKFAMFGGNTIDIDARANMPHGANCGCASDEAKIRTANAIYEEWNTSNSSIANSITASGSHVPLTAGELIRSQTRGIEKLPNQNYVADMPAQMGYAPHNPAEQYKGQSRRKTNEFLAKLGDKLNLINVKLP